MSSNKCPTCGQEKKLSDPQTNERTILEYAASVVSYDKASGEFFFKERAGLTRGDAIFNAKFAGKKAGYVNAQGYVVMGLNHLGKPRIFRCHRLVWFIEHGDVPDGQIDHINRNRTDNRISNLRCVTNSENAKNKGMLKRNSSGVTGVSWKENRGKWLARVKINYKEHYLGYFDDLHIAATVVRIFRSQNGFSDSHGQ